MNPPAGAATRTLSLTTGKRVANRLLERLRRSISEFLAIPILIVAVFFALAITLYVMDTDAGTRSHWGAVRLFLGQYVGDGAAATSLLTTIAGSLITVTSITFSILLLAVQQGASALTSQIIDHYLRRASNRVYFGFFVGTSVFTLVTLVLTNASSRPVLGVTFATLFAGLSLFALILLIYSTIDQIRPVTVINTIHDTTLAVRNAQLEWLAQTAPYEPPPTDAAVVLSDRNGYLARVRLKQLQRIAEANPHCVVTILHPIGQFVACGMPLAAVTGASLDEALTHNFREALPLEEQRDIDCDAALGVDHLVNIAWTTTSTAKSNPAVSVAACQALQDMLVRWSNDDNEGVQNASSSIRYPDQVMRHLMDGLESIVVVTSESMQHQTLAVVMEAIASAFAGCTPPDRDRLEQVLLTSMPTLGDHVPTGQLERRYAHAIEVLRRDGRHIAADRIQVGWDRLAETRGMLKSRGNRDER